MFNNIARKNNELRELVVRKATESYRNDLAPLFLANAKRT